MKKIIDNFQGLHGKKLLAHIWNYYKLPIVLLLMGIYVIIYVIFRNVTAKNPEFYLGFANVSAGEELHSFLTDEFLEKLNTGNPRSSIYSYDGLLLTYNVDTSNASYVNASQMKILAAIDGQMMDVVLMDQEAFDAFSQNGYLYPMDEFLLEYLPELSDDLTPFWVDNLEILEDNADETFFHPEVEYHSETTTYPMGLELSFCQPVTDAGFSQSIYLGIIRNTPRPQVSAAFISHLFENQ